MIKTFIRTEVIIVNKDRQLVDWMSDSTHIYNSALYELRQAYFSCKERNEKIKTPNYVQLYHICSKKDEFINSSLDYTVKQQVIRQAINNWKSFIRASIGIQ